ncbi:MAG: imidazole glycerol phosphate synthase subunit HisH [Candidatus Aenigmarchaeota archaeon]|nr:imidazole glycerol phosphate synthase subunit HisH [Candidatus Aenigmarchaeota archaeon]
MIAIIDYGSGNARSVENALRYLGFESTITSGKKAVATAGKIIFPGVGSFGNAMKNLERKGLIGPLTKALENGVPFFGICLGMQVLFEASEESPGIRGLGILEGSVVKFRKGKVPQVGWNLVRPVKKEPFREGFAYFANSYYPLPEDKGIVAATSDYGIPFASAVKRGNIMATQFHPEKSGAFGLEILARWLDAD